MIGRRPLLLVATSLLAVVLITSTGGFSSATTHRSTEIGVAGDDAALVGFEQAGAETPTNVTITITNRLPSGTPFRTVTVTVGTETAALATDDALAPGEQASATFSAVSCGDPITVEVTTEETTVTLERTVQCQ